MIEKSSKIPELYELQHINDNKFKPFDWQNNLYRKSLSNVLFKNDKTAAFLNQMQMLSVWLIESTLVIRNFLPPS